MPALSVRVKAPISRLSFTDISGKTRRPSGTMAMPILTISSGLRAVDAPALDSGSRRTGSRFRPVMARRIDDLAGAVGADQRDGLALVDVERDAFQRIDVVVVELDVREGEQRVHAQSPIVSSSMPR